MVPALSCPTEPVSTKPAAAFSGSIAGENVVEIGLLVPADWVVALVELSKKHHESVAQLLRPWIGRELVQHDSIV